MFERERTSTELVMYALYLYFLGLSFRNTSKALGPFKEKRSHVDIWNWVQQFNPKMIYSRKRTVTAFVIDETMISLVCLVLVVVAYVLYGYIDIGTFACFSYSTAASP
jgi:transposase-like protein